MARADAIARIAATKDKDRQIVADAYRTPTGKALIDLITEMYGDPKINDNEFKTFVELGQFQVVRFLQRKLEEDNFDV